MVDDYWIKALGMGAREQQFPDDWRGLSGGLFQTALTSAVQPAMRPGHGIVYYASGIGLVFAAGVITSFPYRFDDPAEPDWPWRVNVELTASRDFIHDGVPLEALNVAGRDLRQTIKRRSHIRLRAAEYAEAVRLLQST